MWNARISFCSHGYLQICDLGHMVFKVWANLDNIDLLTSKLWYKSLSDRGNGAHWQTTTFLIERAGGEGRQLENVSNYHDGYVVHQIYHDKQVLRMFHTK